MDGNVMSIKNGFLPAYFLSTFTTFEYSTTSTTTTFKYSTTTVRVKATNIGRT